MGQEPQDQRIRVILTPGSSNLYHLWGPLTHLPVTTASGMWRSLEKSNLNLVMKYFNLLKKYEVIYK